MAGEVDNVIESTCPECGVASRMDRRFVVWCEVCSWNVDPEPATAPSSRRARRAKAYGERLIADLMANGPSGATVRRTPALFATAVLLWAVWVGLAILGVWLVLVWRSGVAGLVLAAPVFLLVYMLRPRLGEIDDGAVRVSRSDAPGLHELVDAVAEAVGSPPVDVIMLDGEFNASVWRVGLRRRVVLTLGAPMWLSLPPDQRVALIAHELAHVRNGDPRRGFFVWTAATMLATWHEFLSPPETNVSGGLEQLIAKALMAPPAWLVGRLVDWFVGLGLRSGLQAEYLSDHAAAHVAGTEAVIGLLDSLLLAPTAEFAITRAALDGADSVSGWGFVQQRVQGVPAHEAKRLLVVAERRDHVEDDSHPPTAFRRRFIADSPQHSQIDLSTARSQAIDEQLESPLAEVWATTSRRVHAQRFH